MTKKYRLMILILLLLLAIGGIPDSCFGQSFFPARILETAVVLDTNLDYVGTASASANDATYLDVTYTIPAGHTNKLIVFEWYSQNWTSNSVTSVQRTSGSTISLTQAYLAATDATNSHTGIYYLLDSNMPSSGDITIRVTMGTTCDFAGRIRFYNGALQTASVATNTAEYENCGWYTSDLVVNSNSVGWTWTTNACVLAAGCVINGASTGSQIIDATGVDGSAGPTSPSPTGTGHTQLGLLQSNDAYLYSGYK